MVDYFGKNLAEEGDVFKFGSVNESIEEKLNSFKIKFKIDELIDPIYNFDFPINPHDFPSIGGITKEKLNWLKPQLDQIDISPDQLDYKNEAFDEFLESIYILRRGVNFCLDNNFDWISFAH